MKTIFEYSDYHLFLSEYLASRKQDGTALTYDSLARAIGATSKGFITQIVQGKSKIPSDKITKFALALGLKKKERTYFDFLVRFHQAGTHSRKNEIFKKLTAQFKTKIAHLGPDQYEFYDKWYYSAVRSLLGYYPFTGDFAALARQLGPAITPSQARKTIDLLARLSLIEKRQDGCYHVTDRIISAGEPINAVAIVNFQQETMDLAKMALEKVPKKHRSDSTLTLGLSEAGYRSVAEKIDALRKELLDVARYDTQIDRVVQINLHAFPMTRVAAREKQ